MGLNTYLEAVGSKGYKAASTTAAGCYTTIDGKPGKRLSIFAYGFQNTGAATTPDMYIMDTLLHTTVGASGGASGATTITVSAFSSAPATSGYIVVVLDNGTYQWLTVASTASTTSVPISSALTDDATEGNQVYYLGLYNTASVGGGHYRVKGSASGAQKSDKLEPGIFFGSVKGAPMQVLVIDAASTALCQLDYCSYGYINV